MSLKTERQTAIRRHLYSHGPSTVGRLAQVLGTSVATLRRDLTSLEEQGVVDRVHGGARLAEGSTVEVAFESREGRNLDAKRAIAEHAFGLIRPHATCFLDASTTVLQLVRRLRIDPMPVTVFTNGLVIAQALLNVPRVRVMLLGGRLRNENASIVGPQAEYMLEHLWFDKLFLGAGAVNDDGSIYGVDVAEASLNTLTLKRSGERYLLADSSKFGAVATYAVASLGSDTHVITDHALSQEWRRKLTDRGVPVTIVPALSATTLPTASALAS